MVWAQRNEGETKATDLPVQPSLVRLDTYPHGFVGLEAVHVVGSPKAPGGEELEEVDLHRRFNEHDEVRGQPEAVWKHGQHTKLNGSQFGQNPRSSSSYALNTSHRSSLKVTGI